MNSLVKLQRRTFLAALGLGIAAPFALKLSRWAVARPAARPVRLFSMFLPHGYPVEHFDPLDSAGKLQLDAKGVGVLKPLEPYKNLINLVRGIGMADGAFNHGAISAAFTGRNYGGGAGEVSLPTVDSFDYLIAQKLGVPAQALAVVPHDGNRTHWSNLYSHGKSWTEGYRDPVEAADKLFASLGTGVGGVDEAPFRKEAVELTQRQVGALRQQVTGLTREETKLSKHLEALEALKVGDDGTGITACTTRPALPAVEAAKGIDPLSQADFTKLFHAHLEAAANAMVCGTSLVTSLQCLWVNADIRMDFAGGPGLGMSYHMDLSHGGGQRPQFATTQQWFYQQLADKLLTVLNQDDPADPGHTVLENSIVYVCTEISDGMNHNSDAGETWIAGMQPTYTYLPQVLIGGGGGYLKTGGNIAQVEDDRPHTDVLGTIAEAMGAPLTEVGGVPFKIIEELKA